MERKGRKDSGRKRRGRKRRRKYKGNEVVEKCREFFQGCVVRRADKNREEKDSEKKKEATQGTVDFRKVWQMLVSLGHKWAQGKD